MGVPREGDDLRPGWAAVAMRSAVGSEAASGSAGVYEFRIDGEVFHLRVGDGEVEACQGAAPEADLVLVGEPETLLALTSGRLSPEEAVESGALTVEGGAEESRDALLARCLAVIGPTEG